MQRFLLTGSLLLATCCLGNLAWGGDEISAEHVDHLLTSTLPESDSTHASSNSQFHTPLFQSSLTSTYKEAPNPSPRLRDLTPHAARPHARGLLAKTTWLHDTFSTETEIAHSQNGPGWLQTSIPGDTGTTASSRLIRLGLTSAPGAFQYGLTYRSAGQDFVDAPDQARREAWGEWTTGRAKLRGTVGQLWNNVAGDTTRPRLEQTYGRMGVTLAKASWPELSMAYTRNSLSSALEPPGIVPQQTRSHIFDGALAYRHAKWQVRLLSMYTLADGVLRGEDRRKMRMQVLNVSFGPLRGITVTPILSYREDRQELSGVHTESPSASLAVRYRQSRRLLISGKARYASSRSSDGLVDHESVGGNGKVQWRVQRSSAWNTLISIEARYHRLTDRVVPTAGTEDISGLIRLTLAAL